MSERYFRIIVRRAARTEILKQTRYYRLHATATVAERWRKAADTAAKSLRTLPERGSSANSKAPDMQGIRKLPIEGFPKHFLFYHVDPEGSVIVILRMLHGARDILSAMNIDED